MNRQTHLQGISIAAIAAVFVLAVLVASAMLFVSPANALSRGDTFKKDGNIYKVTDLEDDMHDTHDGEVMLVKYGSSDKTPTINTVKYRGEVYEVEVVGKGAFNTAKGHKITSVTFGKDVDEVKANAFRGCKKLKTINLRKSDLVDIEFDDGVWQIDDLDIAGTAFKNAGKGEVTVKCGSGKAIHQKLFAKAMKKTGLKSFRVVK